jgi:hypothetical protein
MPTTDIAQFSLEADEPLTATAPRAVVWLLLEYNGAWGAKALDESDLPATVKAFLNEQSQRIPNTRFQFIKHDTPGRGITFYVARASLNAPFLYRFRLDAYEDLLTFDLPELISAHSEQTMSEERLFLVCTNGKRDAACAKYGLPLYQAMSREAGSNVWQTTHLGGHRFAATMACLPHGVLYGRLPPEQARAIVDDYHHNRLTLDYYRGCAAYDAPTQAAEDHLRRLTAEARLNAFGLIHSVADGDNRWAVQFQTRAGHTYDLLVRAVQSEFVVYESTRNAAPNPVMQYQVEVVS